MGRAQPGPRLSPQLFESLIECLCPWFEEIRERRAIIVGTFGVNAPVLNHIDWSGAPYYFAVGLVETLLNHGDLEDGRPALTALLEAIGKKVGLGTQDRITDLIEQIQDVVESAQMHFLASVPLNWQHPEVNDLHALLCKMYWEDNEVIILVRRAGIPASEIPWNEPMSDAWITILDEAQNRGKMRALLQAVLADEGKTAFHPHLETLLGWGSAGEEPEKE